MLGDIACPGRMEVVQVPQTLLWRILLEAIDHQHSFHVKVIG